MFRNSVSATAFPQRRFRNGVSATAFPQRCFRNGVSATAFPQRRFRNSVSAPGSCEWFLRVVFTSGFGVWFCEWFLRVVVKPLAKTTRKQFASGSFVTCGSGLRVVFASSLLRWNLQVVFASNFASGFESFASGF